MRLTPKNWHEFQHYKDRSPAWIKLHRNILDDYAFHCLPDASRALAPCIWLLASEYDDGTIDADEAEIAFRVRLTVDKLRDALKPLIDGGFFIVEHDASAALAGCKQDASLEKEGEKEKERELEGAKQRRKTLDYSKWPEQPSEQVLTDWLAHRKRVKAPASQTVVDRLAGKLSECVKAGYTVDDCLSESVTRGWRGLELEWLKNAGVKPSRRPDERPPDQKAQARQEYQDLHSRVKADEQLGVAVDQSVLDRLEAIKQQMRVNS